MEGNIDSVLIIKNNGKRSEIMCKKKENNLFKEI